MSKLIFPNDVHVKCTDPNWPVLPDANNLIDFDFAWWWWDGDWRRAFVLIDSQAGIGGPPASFVLISPELPKKTILALMGVLIEHKAPCGFCIEQAGFYPSVYVVGKFPAKDLKALKQLASVKTVKGETDKEKKDDLKQKLSNP